MGEEGDGDFIRSDIEIIFLCIKEKYERKRNE